jgi:dolichyl-diphosphooligosaccharide--protein glycosyltransferase
MNLIEKLKLKKFTSFFRGFFLKRPEITRFALLRNTLLLIILIIAFGVRLLPIRWGYYLSEFDPYYQYRQTKFITENGYLAWTEWHDYMSWFPGGNDVSSTSYPGLALAASTLYQTLSAFGIKIIPPQSLDPLISDPLYNLCVIFPVIMGTATCLVIYFLGRDLGGESVGIFALLFLALDSSFIARTSLGFFDDETVGIFSLLIFSIFFFRSLDSKKTKLNWLFYAIGAGLTLGYLTSSWGASRYPIGMIVLFVPTLLFMKRYSSRLFVSYSITFGLALLTTLAVPYLYNRVFLLETSILPVYAVFLLLCLAEINHRVKDQKKKFIYILSFIFMIIAIFSILSTQGFIKPLEAKFLSLINPFQRISYPLVESVAEHRPSARGTFYYNFGVGVFFVPIGLFFAAMMATNLSIFLIIYCLSAIYFASSMIRLNIILAPAICLLWALALTKLLKPFVLSMKDDLSSRHKKRFKIKLGKDLIGGILAIMLIIFLLTYVIGTDFIAGPQSQGPRIFAQSYSPTTISASSMPLRPSSTNSEWLNALRWMRWNLPPSPSTPDETGTVIACWWDYGYWITIMANKTTLADNGTFNWTQIRQIAHMFMSSEDKSIEILKKYNVTHVVVFTTVHTSGYDMPWGEVGKFKWMIRIAGLNESDFGKDMTNQQTSYWEWSSNGMNTTLYKMMTFGKFALGIPLIDGNGQSIPPVIPDHFQLIYPSEKPVPFNGAYYPLIFIYEVKY